jgi:hypothetical protein
MSNLQKRIGHLVSPKDNKLVAPQEHYPKKANDVYTIIAYNFFFTGVPIVKQWVSKQGNPAWIEAFPNKRFHSICYLCSTKATGIHSQEKRIFFRISTLLWSESGSDASTERLTNLNTTKPHRRIQSIRSLSPSQQKTGSPYLRAV